MAAVFGAAIVLAALLIGGRLIGGESSPEDESAEAAPTVGDRPPPTVTEEPEATDPDDPDDPDGDEVPDEVVPPTPCPAAVEDVVCDAATFVQETRGLAFETFPAVDLLAPGAFAAERDRLAPTVDPLPGFDEAQARALGLVDDGPPYPEAAARWAAAEVQGFVAPGAERVVIRGDEFDLYRQALLVRHLTTALDLQVLAPAAADPDQIERPLGAEADFGSEAVLRGDGVRVARRWLARLDGADRRAHDDQAEAAVDAPARDALAEVAPPLRELWAAPEREGASLLDRAARSGGETAVDAEVVDPPTSSEQVLHPGRDRAADPELVVPVPPADGEILGTGRLGELVIRAWLGRVAGDGWGGDRFVRWDTSTQVCLRVDVAGDQPTDLNDLLAAAEGWVAAAPDRRSVDGVVTEAGPLVRITGCG